MEKSVQGEGQGDLFAADAWGFRTSGISLAAIIGVLSIFGIVFEMWRYKKKWTPVSDVGKLSNQMNIAESTKVRISSEPFREATY